MDGLITQIVGPATMASRKREEQRKQLNKRKVPTDKKEAENTQEPSAVYIHGETEIPPATYQRPRK